MVDGRKREIAAPHRQAALAQPIERAPTGALLCEVAVDVDQRSAVAIVLDHVLIPDALERCVGHPRSPTVRLRRGSRLVTVADDGSASGASDSSDR